MKKKIKIIVTVLSMLFFVFLINNKVQAVFEIDKFNIDAIVDESGNMNIIETIDLLYN